MFDEKMRLQIAMHSAALGTTQLILDQIKRAGLEKTLEDLHTAMKDNPCEVTPTNQQIWEGFIDMLKDLCSIRKHGKEWE